MAAVLLQVCGPTAGAQEPPASNAESSGTTRPLKSPGDHLHFLEFDGLRRSCLIHIPPKLDFSKPVPLVLVLHGAAMNAAMMAGFSGMNQEADVSGFVAVYPNGTGLQELLLVWNSGGVGPVRQRPDDVGFIRALLDDLIPELNIDPRRVFATGMSNGGMMSYRLAAELSDKIAAIAPVGGTLAIPDPQPQRPVPLIHFHGTDDGIVPWAGPRHRAAQRHEFQSVPDTIATWLRLTGAQQKPVTEEIPDRFDDGTSVRVHTHPAGKSGAEVVLVEITGGGHTWPGRQPAFAFIGRSTREISANRMIWDFFKKHPMPADP